jgi:hypothetical protein
MISSTPAQLVKLSDTVSVAISLQFFEKILEKNYLEAPRVVPVQAIAKFMSRS